MGPVSLPERYGSAAVRQKMGPLQGVAPPSSRLPTTADYGLAAAFGLRRERRASRVS
jgi:hypothetical protein